MTSLMALRIELVMPPNTTSTRSRWMSLRTLFTATDSLEAVSSMKSCSERPSTPPLALMSLTTIVATFAFALPAKPMWPVRSVAMPILTGFDCPHAGGTMKLPRPRATAPAAHAAPPRSERLVKDGVDGTRSGARYMGQLLSVERRPAGRNLTTTMAMTNTSTSARTGLSSHGSPALSTPITAAPRAGPSNVPMPPRRTARKPWIRKRTPRSANIEKIGTISPPARTASTAAPAEERDQAQAERPDEGIGHRVVETADEPAHALTDDEADGVRAEHGDDRLGVEEPDNAALEREADEGHHERRGHHASPYRIAVAVCEVDRVGAEEQELPVGEIENPHHARDHAETGDHQHHDGAEAHEVEADADDARHGKSLDSCPGSRPLGP